MSNEITVRQLDGGTYLITSEIGGKKSQFGASDVRHVLTIIQNAFEPASPEKPLVMPTFMGEADEADEPDRVVTKGFFGRRVS